MRVTVALLLLCGCLASGDAVTLGATTTLDDSGLLDALVDSFEAQTQWRVSAVIGPTGETLERAHRGDVDLVLSHSPRREQGLLDSGHASERVEIMFSRFVLVGPSSDPAGLSSATNATDAAQRIVDARHPFVSRGDHSGTHDKELELWALTGADVATFDSTWYKETGTGQAATLRVGAHLDAYVLADEPTWIQMNTLGRTGDLQSFSLADETLRNPYALLRLPQQSQHKAGATQLFEWLQGPDAATIIDDFRIGPSEPFTSAGGSVA